MPPMSRLDTQLNERGSESNGLEIRSGTELYFARSTPEVVRSLVKEFGNILRKNLSGVQINSRPKFNLEIDNNDVIPVKRPPM